jgi:hypothetical protein
MVTERKKFSLRHNRDRRIERIYQTGVQAEVLADGDGGFEVDWNISMS